MNSSMSFTDDSIREAHRLKRDWQRGTSWMTVLY